MRTVFADTSYYLALVLGNDRNHTKALAVTSQFAGHVVTSYWVITELGNALSSPEHRGPFLRLVRSLQRSVDVTVVPPALEDFEKGMSLYERRADKSWSLTDCISFTVMHDNGIAEALTTDRHFEQAGFKALLR